MKKNETSLEELCEGVPNEFLLYMRYVRNLRFKQKPDYDLLRNLFSSLFNKHNFDLDYVYDWNVIAKHKKTSLLKKKPGD